MKETLTEAKKSLIFDEVPVGAVIKDRNTGKIIARAHNQVETLKNPMAHAEMLVIEAACRILDNKFLEDCELFVTLEPCPMCAQAISFARIHTLYFGAYDIKSGGVEHGPRIFQSSSCHHRPNVYGGIEEEACGQLLRDFFAGKRY